MNIILIIIIAIISIIGLVPEKTLSQKKKLLTILPILIISVVLQILMSIQENKTKKASASVGKIVSEQIILSFPKRIFPKLQLGDRGPVITGDLSIFERRGLEIKTIDNQIYISISVTDLDGNIIAEIKDNEWKVNLNKSFDRNYSRYAFEVKDNYGNIVLQTQLKGDTLQFQGVLYDPSTELFLIVTQQERDGRMDGLIKARDKGKRLETSIEPIFKYPSKLHLGELAGN